MEINKIHHQDSKSLPSRSLIKVSTTVDTNETGNMKSHEHEGITHSTSKISLSKRYSSLSPQHPIRFIGLSAQVFLYYVAYSYLIELLFTLKGFSNTAWFLTCYQFFIYGILSFMQLGFIGLSQRRASYRSYIILASLSVSTMGLSNYAVGYLNYPTLLIFKCCKLIPVLIGGIIIQKKRFNRYDVAAAFCMSIGLIFFTLADSKVQPNFNTYGVILICLALVADAIIGNYQEKVMKTHHVSNVEMVFYSFIFGFLIILIGLLYPFHTYGYSLIISIFGYLGMDIVLTLIKEYGALICVTVTTCRKAITIILSFILFSKPFVFDYVWSGFIVVIGIYLNVYGRNQVAFNAKIALYGNRLFPSRWRSKFLVSTSSRSLLPIS
ncbi:unnamed protein product [Rotaria sordida]|uniref:Adenosine 3'-phospho 5'-phosphosulfate transporter 2 n=1 Tax=Rotaria sordida TaxID=392033 RepID=A0A818ZPC0_9BILA|nr:unnamed protein product [Rotaria sordida]